MTESTDPSTDWFGFIRAEYLEMPGLHLTKAQMQLLWGMDPLTCDRVLEALVAAHVLKRTPQGGYILAKATDRLRIFPHLD